MIQFLNFCAHVFPAARWELAAFPFASVLSADYNLHLASPSHEPEQIDTTEPFPSFDQTMTAKRHEHSQHRTIRVRSRPLLADKLFSDIQTGTSRQRANVKNLLDGGLRLIDTSNTNYPLFGAPLTRYPPRSPTDWTFSKRAVSTQRSVGASVLTKHFKPKKRGPVILGRWFEDTDGQLRREVSKLSSCCSPSTATASSPKTPSSSPTAYSASPWAPVQFLANDIPPTSTLVSSFSPSELEALEHGSALPSPTVSLTLSAVINDSLPSVYSSPFQSIPNSPAAGSPSIVSEVYSSPFQSIPDETPAQVSPMVISIIASSAFARPRSLELALISPIAQTFLESPLNPPTSPSIFSLTYSASCPSKVPDSALFGGFDIDDKDFSSLPSLSTHDGPVKRIRRFLKRTSSLYRRVSLQRFY